MLRALGSASEPAPARVAAEEATVTTRPRAASSTAMEYNRAMSLSLRNNATALPSRPARRAPAIAAFIASTACGYSERM